MLRNSGVRCAALDCDNALKTGARYCSRSCAATDRERKKKIAQHLPPPLKSLVPAGVRKVIYENMNADDAERTIADMVTVYLQRAPKAPPTRGRTVGGRSVGSGFDISVYDRWNIGELRPADGLGFDDIELMRQNGQVVFTLTLKKAPVRTIFRNERSWHVESKDNELAEVSEGNLRHILPRAMPDILSMLDYGSSFFEMIWKYASLKELGLRRSSNKTYAVLEGLDSVYPGTVRKIRRKNGRFNGFVQDTGGVKGEVSVPVEQALLFTYNGLFRNKWGESYLLPMFAFWYWYEVVWRMFLRYMERTSTPVVLGRAPQSHRVEDSSGHLVDAMDKAFEIALEVSTSNAAVLPSDKDDSGEFLWTLEYLQDNNRVNAFIDALELLGTMIIRSGLLADRVATQEREVGSYNIASIHYIMTQLHNEWILDDIVRTANDYLLPKFSLYNRGSLTASALHLVTEGLDIEEKGRLFQLLMKLSDAKHPDLQRVDVVRSLEIQNVPVKSLEDFERDEKDALARSIEKMKAVQEVQAKDKPEFPQDKKKGGGNKQNDRQRAEQSMSAFVQALVDSGGAVPALITEGTVNALADRGIGVEIGEYKRIYPSVLLSDEEEEDDEDITEGEWEQIKEELLSQLDLPEDVDEATKNAIWLLVLQGMLEDAEALELPEEVVITLGEYAGAVDLGIADWIKGVVNKAKGLINKVVKAVTGKIADWKEKRWQRSAQRQYSKAKKEGKLLPGGYIITKDGRVWRPGDHPRDEAGRFTEKGTGEEKEDDSGITTEIVSTTVVSTGREPEEGAKAGWAPTRPPLDIPVTYVGNVPENVRESVESMMELAGQDEYLSSHASAREIAVGSFAGLKQQYPEWFREGEIKAFTAGSFRENPETGEMMVFIYSDAAALHVAERVGDLGLTTAWVGVHELHHSVMGVGERKVGSRGEKHEQGEYSYAGEEATTELLTRRVTRRKYPKPDFEQAYEPLCQSYVQAAKFRTGSVEQAWADLQHMHEGFGSVSRTMQFIDMTFPSLTAPQRTRVVEKMRDVESFDPFSSNTFMNMAARMYFENLYGNNPVKLKQEWNEYTSTTSEWLFEGGQ